MHKHLKVRNQEAEVHGLPTLNLDSMMGTDMPTDFEFEALFGDIVMCEIIDENENGEVNRDGIWIKQDVTRKLWRKAKVVLKGPKCLELEIGDIVAYPSDRGIPMVTANKTKYIFLNMERLFGKLKA